MRVLLSLALCVLCAAPAAAASFDCAKAGSAIEKAICGDPALSKADERLAETFAAALKESLNPQALRAEQRQWLSARDKVKDPSTLPSAYDDRIAALAATIDHWRALAKEIDAAALGKGCLAVPDAPDDAACAVDDSGTIESHEDNFLFQIQSYTDGGLRVGGSAIVLERITDPKTGREAGRLKLVVAAYDESAHYGRPQLIGSRVASWLVIPGHLEGTGDFNAGLLFSFDPDGKLHDVDTDAWQRDLARRLPKGLAVWKGIYPDYGKMTAETPLWQKGDANCCPTGGRATISLGLKGQRLVLEEVKVERGEAAARRDAATAVPAAADDADRGTDLCGKTVAYKINAESFANGPPADDKQALATARGEAPVLIHRAFKDLCATKRLQAAEVAVRIDTVVISWAGGADNFAAYFPDDKKRPKTLATEWIWTGTDRPDAEDVRAGILCAFKPKQQLCREREP